MDMTTVYLILIGILVLALIYLRLRQSLIQPPTVYCLVWKLTKSNSDLPALNLFWTNGYVGSMRQLRPMRWAMVAYLPWPERQACLAVLSATF